MIKQDYTMYVHPSFRLTMSGNFTSILQLLKSMGQKEYDAKVKELVDSICKDSNLKFMGESLNKKNQTGFVFIDAVDQLVSVAEEKFKQQNINGRVVKIIISDDESVKKDAPICIIHGKDVDVSIPSIAYLNKEGESLPYEYNVVNLTNETKVEEDEGYFYDETYKDTISEGEDEHYDHKYDKQDWDMQ